MCSLVPTISVLKTNVKEVIKIASVREDACAENASLSVPTRMLRTGELLRSSAQPTSAAVPVLRVICHENSPVIICHGLLVTFPFLISLPWLCPSFIAKGNLFAFIMKALSPLCSSLCLLLYDEGTWLSPVLPHGFFHGISFVFGVLFGCFCKVTRWYSLNFCFRFHIL